MKFEHTSGGFTLPGESGQEKLTLELAKKWGADVIRDSDGTQLSDEILNAGYDIYSTICIIRDHNAWAKEHPECLQQSFLSTEPVIAAEEPLTVKPMAGFFDEQFKINDRPEALRYWQVWGQQAAACGRMAVGCCRRYSDCGKFSAVPCLHGQLFGMAHLGRDQHVQPCYQQLDQ